MWSEDFFSLLHKDLEIDFFTGVPDSLLSPFTDIIMENYGVSENHIVAANEGNAVGLAAGYHLSTGKIPCVYLQNSGQGNIVNPYASLMAPEVYNIPCVFVIGWRGEPGVKDEPQHIFQGQITTRLMEDMQIEYALVSKETSAEDLKAECVRLKNLLSAGKCVSFIVRKGAIKGRERLKYSNRYVQRREDVIRELIKVMGEDIVVCTTGKASRELFEIREQGFQTHGHDFLTVGSMGHSSSIALEIALNKRKHKVWCIDGDGALLMHMGAMAVIGANSPDNLIHILINNEAHETVGGMPTVSRSVDFMKIAEGCGYKKTIQATSLEEAAIAAWEGKHAGVLTFIEIKTGLGARDSLGRPTIPAAVNKKMFMEYIGGLM